MLTIEKCPICNNLNSDSCTAQKPDRFKLRCDVCGSFEITKKAASMLLDHDANHNGSNQRALISHLVCTADRQGQNPVITRKWLRNLSEDRRLPNPAARVTNLIRFIGQEVEETGQPLAELPINTPSIIGAPNRNSAMRLVMELCDRKMLKGTKGDDIALGGPELRAIDLTLDGWTEYESSKRGKFAGQYGFMAMKFNDEVLDRFIQDVVGPAIKERIGYNLLDMRDVQRAGIIDNHMRMQIRDSAFVLVDLTHDNSGAYWEAGYAEGLDKPVVYICDQDKYDAVQTHFDTNHCTTVLWSLKKPDEFISELVATLRRSLDLFETKSE